MPLYEYQCHACEKSFELIVGLNEKKDDQTCPKCNSQNTSRLISLFSSAGVVHGTASSSSCSPNTHFT